MSGAHETGSAVRYQTSPNSEVDTANFQQLVYCSDECEEPPTKRYSIQYPICAYTFPTEARIHQVRFDEKYLHVELTDERILSIPLWWIPTLHNASAEQRAQVQINRSRTMLVWDPEQCGINDELKISDFLGPMS